MEQEIKVISENLEQEIEVTKEDIGYIPTGTKEITSNGIYNITEYEKVNVDVPGIVPSGTQTFINNGIYDVSTYEFADVQVPQPSGSINITENGEIDVTNYETANVKVIGLKEINNAAYLFYQGERLNQLEDLMPLLKDVSSCVYMFSGCRDLEEDIDFSSMIGSNLTKTAYMFQGCQKLLLSNLINFDKLDTSNVDTMSYMFANLGYNAAGNIKDAEHIVDLNFLNTSNVVYMDYMFQYFYNAFPASNTKKLIIDISTFDTRKVTTMANMFRNCQTVEEINMSGCETPSLTNTTYMFAYCRKLKKLDIRSFDFTNLTYYSNMFNGVPTDCLIIVKDDTQKNWMASNYSTLTNVKTVAEYEV